MCNSKGKIKLVLEFDTISEAVKALSLLDSNGVRVQTLDGGDHPPKPPKP